jgi:hypothetical protein
MTSSVSFCLSSILFHFVPCCSFFARVACFKFLQKECKVFAEFVSDHIEDSIRWQEFDDHINESSVCSRSHRFLCFEFIFEQITPELCATFWGRGTISIEKLRKNRTFNVMPCRTTVVCRIQKLRWKWFNSTRGHFFQLSELRSIEWSHRFRFDHRWFLDINF